MSITASPLRGHLRGEPACTRVRARFTLLRRGEMEHKSICPQGGCPGVRARNDRPRHKYTALSGDSIADQRFIRMRCTQDCGEYYIEEINIGHGFQFVGYAGSADYNELPTSSKDIPMISPLVGEWTLRSSRGISEPKGV